jgi:RNA-directed DNA polymerase
MTVEAYAEGLTERLAELCDRVHSGRYRAQPVRRIYIPKGDGERRPLGLPTLEDKIVQGAVAEVLSAVYEADFLECSYGFRPARSAHQALRVVHRAVMSERVNWVLEADIRKFFDSVDHNWLLRMIRHRIADPRVLELIRQWLEAGVLENGTYADTVEGTPQGAGISPLLANIFLHYALDLWVRQWCRQHATGRMRLVRYGDDFLLTLERREDGERMLAALRERLAKFGLQLHEGKTRLIEFGCLAAERRKRRGEGRPQTFNFLGFTHYCAKTRRGRFIVLRKTQRQRMNRKLKEMRRQMWRQMHRPVREQHAWLSAALRGYYAYYGITGNSRSLGCFRHQVCRMWHYVLMRRSQKRRLSWERFSKLLKAFPLPWPRIVHLWRCPEAGSGHPLEEPDAEKPHVRICEGGVG